MMTWRTAGILGSILFLATILSIQGAEASPPYVRDGAPTEVTFDEDETFSGLNLYDVFADDDPVDARLNLTHHQVEDLEISIDQSTGQIIISAPKSYHGEVDVVFEAIDSNGSFVLHEITIFILPVNDPPVIRKYIPLLEMDEEDTFSIDLENYQGGPVFEDNEGKPLTYKFDHDGDIIASISGSVITFTAATDFTGFFSDLIIWAEDDLGARSEIMRLSFTVRNGHTPNPWVTLFEPSTRKVTIEENVTIIFKILEVSVIELEEWSFKWYVNGKEVVDNNSSVMWFPDFSSIDQAYNTSGVYKISVRLHHWEGDWERTTPGPQWSLTVLEVNRPPIISMLTNDRRIVQGDEISLHVIGQDPDGDDLTYRWLYTRDLGTSNEIGTGEELVLNKNLSPGAHYFSCEVSDGMNNTTSDWVTFNVERETPGPSSIMAAMALLSIVIALVVFPLRHRC